MKERDLNRNLTNLRDELERKNLFLLDKINNSIYQQATEYRQKTYSVLSD